MAKRDTTVGEFLGLKRLPKGYIGSTLSEVDKFLSDPATQEALERINNQPESESHAWLPKPTQD